MLRQQGTLVRAVVDEGVDFGRLVEHGIHADLRNYHNKTGKRANAFYVMNDRSVFVDVPESDPDA